MPAYNARGILIFYKEYNKREAEPASNIIKKLQQTPVSQSGVAEVFLLL
jgi:hypothetical protein